MPAVLRLRVPAFDPRTISYQEAWDQGDGSASLNSLYSAVMNSLAPPLLACRTYITAVAQR